MLSLELTGSSFDFTVLSQFRTRLLAGGGERWLLDRPLEILKEQELLKALNLSWAVAWFDGSSRAHTRILPLAVIFAA